MIASIFSCNPAAAAVQKQPRVPVAPGLRPTLQRSIFTGEEAGQDERKTSKARDTVVPQFFSAIIYHFSQSPALFLPRFLLYYVNVCGGWACLRVCLREGFEGRMDRQQDGSGGASKCTGCRGAACRSHAGPRAGTGTQQPWSRELCPAACSCSRRSWALPWWWARELAASAKVNLCWSLMVRLKHSKVVRAVEIKML